MRGAYRSSFLPGNARALSMCRAASVRLRLPGFGIDLEIMLASACASHLFWDGCQIKMMSERTDRISKICAAVRRFESVGGGGRHLYLALFRLNGSRSRYVGLFECGAVSFPSFLFVSSVRRKRRLGIHLDSIRLDAPSPPSARSGGREGGVNDLVNFSEI